MVSPSTQLLQAFQLGNRRAEVAAYAGDGSSGFTPFILLDDIQNVFPQASAFFCGGVTLEYMTHARGERILPLRIASQPGHIIQVTVDLEPHAPELLPTYSASSSRRTTPPPPISSTTPPRLFVSAPENQVKVFLANSDKATKFYQALVHKEEHQHTQDLWIVLEWNPTVSDLKALRDAIVASKVTSLHFTCSTAPSNIAHAGLDLFSRTKLADPLWEMISDTDEETRNRIHSLTLQDFHGFFRKVSGNGKEIKLGGRKNQLRAFMVTEKLDWVKDGPKIVELLKRSPELKELHLGCLNLKTMAAGICQAIKNLPEAKALTLLTLTRHGLDSQSIQLDPQTRDALLWDVSAPTLTDSVSFEAGSRLKSIRVRSVANATLTSTTSANRAQDDGSGFDAAVCTSLLIKILQQNAQTLTKMVVDCSSLTEFYPIFTALQKYAREHQVNTGEKGQENQCRLRELTLTHVKSRMTTLNLLDDHSAVLELASLNVKVGGMGLNELFKAYGYRLFKMNVGKFHEISGADWKALEWSTRVHGHGIGQLTHLTLTCSLIRSKAFLDDIRALIERSTTSIPTSNSFGEGHLGQRRTLEELVVRVDIPYKKKGALTMIWEKFLLEIGDQWTQIAMVHEFDEPPWVAMLKQSGRMPRLEKVLVREVDNHGRASAFDSMGGGSAFVGVLF